ncbi:MAG: hypothetical protein V2I54_01105 [Bacteroidales bacterium]|jgi:thioredoxin-related protein|nr:hypothetical protein [Bacteroidales bacterium]
MRKIFTLIITLLISLHVIADHVNKEEAKQLNVEKDIKTYNVSMDRKGLFIIRVTTENNQYSLPVIVH